MGLCSTVMRCERVWSSAAVGVWQYGGAVCGPVQQWAYGPVAACMWGGYANRSAKAEGQRQVNGREVCSRVRKM